MLIPCRKCQKQISNVAPFCPYCGSPTDPKQEQQRGKQFEVFDQPLKVQQRSSEFDPQREPEKPFEVEDHQNSDLLPQSQQRFWELTMIISFVGLFIFPHVAAYAFPVSFIGWLVTRFNSWWHRRKNRRSRVKP